MGNSIRIKTKYNGVFYRETLTNGKPDKTYYIRYDDANGKNVELKLGKYSEGIYRDWETDRKSTRLNSSHRSLSRMPSSA